MQNEIWLDIPGYDGIYQVSNLGRLKSYDRLVDYGKIKAIRKGRVLASREGKLGYLYNVFSVDLKRKTVKPHRIVAEVFIPNPHNKPCVNHINGIKSDNRVENLEWVTYKENVDHAFKTKLKSGIKGEKSHLSKLKKYQVDEIRSLYKKENTSKKDLSILYNVSVSQINRIVNYINWNITNDGGRD